MSLFLAGAFLVGAADAVNGAQDQLEQKTVSIPVPTENPLRLGKTASRDINFVLRGWKLVDKVEGDLDGDGLTDSVLIIQQTRPEKMVENKDRLGMDFYDANPRAVLVVLQKNQGEYHLSAASGSLIPDHDQPTISDPFEDVRLQNGSLYLDLRFFANAVSWTTFSRQFQFRWNGEAMALVGFESAYVHRGSGEMRQTSVNYLAGKRKDAKGSIEDDAPKWEWSDIAKDNRPILGSIGNGFEFEG